MNPVYRTVRVGQWAVQATILGAALWLAAHGSTRALILAALVPIAFGPFSYARLRLQRRLTPPAARANPAAWGLAIAGLGLDAIMTAQLLTARTYDPCPALHGAGVTWLGPVWFSAHVLLFVGLVTAAMARRVGTWCRRLAKRQRLQPAVPPDLDRRQFIQHVGVLGVGTPFVVSLTGIHTSYDFKVQEHTIVLPRWPRHLDGLRVAHLSDIHVGGAMNRPRLLHVASLTVAARPDLVVHTGDFLTHRHGDFDAPLYEALARIRVPHGQWACLGNHDYDDPARLVRRLAEAGVRTLRNEVARVFIDGHPLDIAGLDYVFAGAERQPQVGSVLRRWPVRDDTPRVLLNHDPRTFDLLPVGCADLVCSGHTHGGHIGVQLSPTAALTVVGLLGLPDQGLFAREDLRLFVTRCVGFYGYPMRLGIPPEISVLTLRSATAGRSAAGAISREARPVRRADWQG